MSIAGVASAALAVGMTAAPAQANRPAVPDQPTDTSVSVEQRVWDELGTGETDFWVYFGAQADLTAAVGITDRAAQGWYVYEQLTETAATSQAELLALLAAEDADYQAYWIANTVRVTGDADLLDRIVALPGVAEVTADQVYEIPEPIASAEEPRVNSTEWGIDEINAPQVWETFGVRGEGIVVGSIDTGALYTHAALVNQYRGNLGGGEFDHNYNWHDPAGVCAGSAPCDNNGHGTHVTGTMVGDDGAGNQIGVAPEATWIAAKGCESSSCSQASLLSSGQFILAPTDLSNQNPDPQRRPHIVNNSWGGGATSDPWYQPTVEAWVAAGIFPQFANGNAGPGCGSSGNPGNLSASYAAGAYDSSGNIASFSSRGPSAWDSNLTKPNISAPGVAVRSAWNNGGYNSISGTSMASPHVAGAVALMWSAAFALQWDIEATRELLDSTAIDTENLACGGTAENNNVWGQGKLDVFASVDQSPRGPTGTLAGTVTDAGTGQPVRGATVEVTGEANRELKTGSDGGYAVTLPSGEFTVTVSAFGYADQSAEVTVVEDETTGQDFALVQVDSVTVSGQITDGSGHGWPLYAEVGVAGTSLSTFTDPLTGEYSLSVPINASYELVVESQYPGYADATGTVEVGEADVTLDLQSVVDQCQLAPGYEFSGLVGILGDHNSLLGNYLASEGIPSDSLSWGADVTEYDLIVVNRPGNPGEEAFLQFLADTDAAGVGVVFLDTWSTSGNGVWLLWQHTGNPSARGVGFSSSIPHLYYEVVEEHPILAGFAPGDEILFDETSTFKDYAWFNGYEGEGRTVIATAGRADTGTVGSGIGVQERPDNRHVLMSMHAAGAFTQPGFWSEEGAQLFLNALEWAAVDASFGCVPVEGGLVVGQVIDANTEAGLNGATVTSVGNPDEAGESGATPDDPALADGFYWLFSSLTGPAEFTAAASGYTSATESVTVAVDAATQADFSLGAGELTLSATEVEATLRLGQSTNASYTVTNSGTVPVEFELTELAGSFSPLSEGEDVPWLSVSPATASLAPGQAVKVTVSLDADVDQPGTYTAGVGIEHDTPYEVAPVAVSMVVTPPNNWGKVTGTVIGVNCQGNTEPLAGAVVQVNGAQQQVTQHTDADGNYGYWMSTRNNPIGLVVAANGYIPQSGSAQLRPGRDAVADFVLQPIC